MGGLAFKYRAFISYSHTADDRLASILQRCLQLIGKPWYRRSTIKIFRDQTSLSVTPELWSEIEANLSHCQFFILMASVQAAGSIWVRKEVQWWLQYREIESLFIVVTDGEILWHPESNDFDWQKTTSLPPDFQYRFRSEPLYVDLRWVKETDDLSLRHSKFRDAILTLAAPLYEQPKDELDSEEIRQHRRFRIVTFGVAVVISILAIVSIYFFTYAQQEAVRAEVNWREGESRKLAAMSIDMLDRNESIDDAIKIAIMAWKLKSTSEAGIALQKLEGASSEMARVLGRHTRGFAAFAFSLDSSLLATLGRDGSILLWKSNTWSQDGNLLVGGLSNDGPRCSGLLTCKNSHLLLNESNSRLLVWESTGAMELWDLQAADRRIISKFNHQGKSLMNVAINADGNLIAIVEQSGSLAILDVDTSVLLSVPKTLNLKSVIGVYFDSEGSLLIVEAIQEKRPNGVRVSSWNIRTGEITIGPITELLNGIGKLGYIIGNLEEIGFSRNGKRIILKGHYGDSLVEIRRDLQIHDLMLPAIRIGRNFDLNSDGTSLYFQGKKSDEWELWNLSATPVILSKGLAKDKFVEMKWSSDGRWRAEVSKEKISVWGIDSNMALPIKTINAQCGFQKTQSDCIKHLCEKISPSLDEEQLRKLFRKVMYDKYKSIIDDSICDYH